MADRIEPRLVALRWPPGPGFAAAVAAVWSRGDAVLPLDPGLPDGALAAVLAALRPARLERPDGAEDLPDPLPLAPGTAAVVATSGSTGAPKGVVLSHAALEASARASTARLAATAADRWLCCLPLQHVAGLQVLVRSRLLRVDPVVHAGFDPAAVARADATLVALVPTQLQRLLDAGVDLARFRRVLLGGAAAPDELLRRAAAAGVEVVTSYGMTETAGGCVYDGVPLDGVEVQLAAGDRIAIRGPVLADGYHGRPDLTAAAWRDGWFVSADRGAWDADGRLRVLGRADAVIVTGGENIAAEAVERTLADHPAVADVAVAGRPDRDWGERVVAFVVPADPQAPPTLDELRAHARARGPAAAAPRELVLVDALPRTALGKVARERLPWAPA